MRRNTREPHARRLPALLAFRPLAPGRAPDHRRRLPAWVAPPSPPRRPAVARRPPRGLPRHGPAVLVSGRPALPQSAALVGLAARPLPGPRRPVEHHLGGAADLLRPRALPVLRGGPAPGRTLRPGRPGRGGRPHVGPGLR